MKTILSVCLGMVFVNATGAAFAGGMDGLMKTDRAFSALSLAKGSNAAFLAYIADDARLYGAGSQPPMFGKVAVERRFAQQGSGNGAPKDNQLSWAPQHAEISGDGRLGYTDGTWRFKGRGAKGKPVRLTGHYLTVWRLEHGHWRVVADMGTTDRTK